MKYVYSLLFASIAILTSAQQTTESWMYDGLTREYIQYVPPVYDGSESVPVVFCFHGLGGTMQNFYNIGMDVVADTANFITVFPQAIVDEFFGNSAWNSGAGYSGIYLNPDVDDVGFVMSILDSLSANFNIDPNRIYATGFSMGGFFTNRLACEHPDVFEAVASVAGTIGDGIDCDPSESVRIAHFHGTADQTVGYDVNNFGLNVPDWLSFWQSSNSCSGETTGGPLPDIADDNLTIDYSRNGNCDGSSEVVLYTVNDAAHIWLAPENDIFYTTEIWRFFLGVQPPFSTGIAEHNEQHLEVWPNPSNGMVSIQFSNLLSADGRIELVDMTGKTFAVATELNGNRANLDLSAFDKGSYIIRIVDEQEILTSRIVLQ